MIFDRWENLARYPFSLEFKEIVDMAQNLRSDSFENIAKTENFPDFTEKRFKLCHDAYINIMSFLPIKSNAYEAHKRFVDIHFPIIGYERIEIASVSDILREKAYNDTDVYNEEKDVIFYTKKFPAAASITLNNEYFLLAMPEDAHATLLEKKEVTKNTPEKPTLKGVIKIPLNCILQN